MKTATVKYPVKYFIILPLFAALMMNLSAGALAAKQQDVTAVSDAAVQVKESDVNHAVLARQYERLANKMEAKIQRQVEAFNNKPRTSFFGKHGQHIKEHVTYKIRRYEKIAQENLEKAAYHRKIAREQSLRESVAESKGMKHKTAPMIKTRHQLLNKDSSL